MVQQKALLALALVCLAALPAMNARSLLEEGDLVSLATAALESGQAMSAEESMVMASGAYGVGSMAGSYGGLFDGQTGAGSGTTAATETVATPATPAMESGSQDATKTAAPAPAASTTAKSAALPAHQSAALLAAAAGLAAFLL